MAAPVNSIGWWEPRRSFRPRLVADLRGAHLTSAVGRAILLSLVIGGVALIWITRQWPGIEIQPVRLLARAVLTTLFALGLFIAMLWFIPPRISFTERAIVIQEGQLTTPIPYVDIEGVRIDASGGGGPFLIVERMRPRRRTRRIGIADGVDLAELARFLEKALPGRVTTATAT